MGLHHSSRSAHTLPHKCTDSNPCHAAPPVLPPRCHRLAEPLLVPTGEDLWGCFSWLDLGQRAASGTSGQQPLPGAAQLLATPGALVPALGDVEFATKQALLRDRLAGLSSLEEVALPV